MSLRGRNDYVLTNSMTRSFLLHIWLLAPESRTTNFTSALSLSVLKAAFDFYFLLMHLHSWIDRLVKKLYSKSLEHNVPILTNATLDITSVSTTFVALLHLFSLSRLISSAMLIS